MKQFIHTYFLINISVIFLTSCAAFKNDPNRRLNNLQKHDFEKADGEFTNYPTAEQRRIKRELYPTAANYELTLWAELTGGPQYKDSIKILKEQKVILDFISNRRAVAKLYYQDELIKERRLKGHIKQGCRSFIVIPFFPLIYKRHHYRYRLGLNTENTLVIDNTWNYWIFALFAGDYSKGQRSSEFKRE
jgi:hypothetical protein